jgi:hypothetical protein
MCVPPEDPFEPDVAPGATKRRTLLFVVGGAVAIAAAAGIAYAVCSTRPGAEPGQLVPVRGHSKLQAYGPDWALHRPIVVGPYFRGPGPASP